MKSKTLVTLLLAATVAATSLLPAELLAAPAESARTSKAKKAKPAKKAKKKPAKKAAAAAPVSDYYTGEFVNFGQWKEVQAFLDDMVARHGFTRTELDGLMGNVRYLDSVVQLVKPAPPGKPKNWAVYSSRFIEPIRIAAGVRFWNEHADTLARAEALYGVPAEILAGVIGVETIYGRDTGRFRVVDTLTTLAFAYPVAPNRDARMAFFRGELEATLLYARQTGIDPLSLQGSFAGAVGLPQFMPSNILKYAVDFDGDGHVDLRNSPADAIGSVASFLVGHGWQRDQPGPIVFPATVSPAREWERFADGSLEAKFRPEDLTAAGVVPTSSLPPGMLYGLVDLQNGSEPTEYWVASNNFYTITQYNRSYFYAMSVVELGRALRLARQPVATSAP
ncbi:lytic murein transglycosylase B [Pseudoduganella umbonata]|uniref:Lytic murein transglycosylase B n=1 Tax=Pseudoduganella umbonata TaxID=864828 RepID=A0A4V1EE96_9BURK|nr:lytic murein transglycosylase B [Pseudoduganella umbonata]MBB3223275.1 membrane-bound lytic murein transglycosylase B [Pseudoduganella umbonata]QCP13811.1 lytic murein transglycosylase B [Pseudoduganella umbonata]